MSEYDDWLSRRWTLDDTHRLRELFPTHKAKLELLATRLGRNVEGVLKRAKQVGLIAADPLPRLAKVEPEKAKEQRWQAGWRIIGGHRKYYRSKWEANYARYLQWLVEQKQILGWEHEPKTFWFEGIRRGVVSYKPDFKVVNRDGTYAWHEVKGHMDHRSKMTLKRMAKFFPKEPLKVIDAGGYTAIKARCAGVVPDWE